MNKLIAIIALVLWAFNTNAQKVMIAENVYCLKRDTNISKNQIATSFASIKPDDKTAASGAIGFVARGNRKFITINWVKGKYSHIKLDLDNDIQIIAIVLQLENDSVMTFNPSEGSRILAKDNMHLESDINPIQTKKLLSIKLKKCILVTDPNVQYDLFFLTDQDKKNIQLAAECFLSNVN